MTSRPLAEILTALKKALKGMEEIQSKLELIEKEVEGFLEPDENYLPQALESLGEACAYVAFKIDGIEEEMDR